MCNDQKQLSRKIRTMEDELLRTRDYHKAEQLSVELRKNAYSIIENEVCRGVNNASSFFIYFSTEVVFTIRQF